jgi:hypothetical protein
VNGSTRTRRLVAAGAVGFLLFSYPLLALFDTGATVLGIPVLWAYLFVVWAGLIAAVVAIVRGPG